ncbi:MAG TPA: phosphopantetheine-binding protein [Victivallales bacterium]|nr:phosphopantetheine-binding protein [Victivallales bacterium]|tara:strand:+ start:160 stop:441 length:282 start_codon:yes stop_codon:yes gene_type:complete
MEINKESGLAEIREDIKTMLVDALSLEDIEASEIADDEILFGEGLELDSLDAVEIVVMLQRNYGIELKDVEESKKIFTSIDTLSRYVHGNRKK